MSFTLAPAASGSEAIPLVIAAFEVSDQYGVTPRYGVPEQPVIVASASDADAHHNADFNGEPDNQIDLTELLRVIQFYNSDGYHCAAGGDVSDEGFMPGSGDESCTPHTADWNGGADWSIDLSELLRVIQFYNAGGYHVCDDPFSDEGLCPGAPVE